MSERTVQLVLQYDGSRFAGWQRQPTQATVQGTLEGVFERLFDTSVSVVGAGRTDAGVHARGQSAHLTVPLSWDVGRLRKAANSLLPPQIWIASVHRVTDSFHARYSATARSYTYMVGADDAAASPFRRPYEWNAPVPSISDDLLHAAAATLPGEHQFYGFAVRGTAPESDDHRCSIMTARWERSAGTLSFIIEANRFLHHMVRFLVGTMIDVASGRRTLDSFAALLEATDNRNTSAPAPPHALFLDRVSYPKDLYVGTE